jgi:hypothetical protein
MKALTMTDIELKVHNPLMSSSWRSGEVVFGPKGKEEINACFDS